MKKVYSAPRIRVSIPEADMYLLAGSINITLTDVNNNGENDGFDPEVGGAGFGDIQNHDEGDGFQDPSGAKSSLWY